MLEPARGPPRRLARLRAPDRCGAGGLLWLDLADALGTTTSLPLAAAPLLAVGLCQFTRAKTACQGVCLSPTGYFLGRWRSGAWGRARMGLGLFCAGCCWGFMALGFVGGTMSVLWMDAATVFMMMEKLPAAGRRLTRLAGAALVVARAFAAARAAL